MKGLTMNFSLTINMDNAAFGDEPMAELSGIMLKLVRTMRDGGIDRHGMLIDSNGNAVGSYIVQDIESVQPSFTVIGYYDSTGQRFAEWSPAANPTAAVDNVRAGINDDDLIIIGVVAGNHSMVAVDTDGGIEQ